MPSIINALTASGGGVAITGDATGNLALQTAGNTAVTIDTSQNVGIGTSTITSSSGWSPRLVLAGTDTALIVKGSSGQENSFGASGGLYIDCLGNSTGTNNNIIFRNTSTNSSYTANERMRIDSDGNLLLGVSSSPLTSSMVLYFDGFSRQGLLIKNTANSSNGAAVRFMDYLGNVSGGGIFYTSSNSISYTTSSDYRLKENIAPMTGALEKVTQLKPCTFQWTVDGSDGQGFIAHELQEVIPNAVVGEKDAVDAEGNPRYQGVDTSFLVATLTAAIQELKAELDATKAEVQALKGVA